MPLLKRSLVVLIIVISSSLIHTAIIKELSENLQNPYITMDDKYFCIWDRKQCNIFVYSRKELQKISEFGRQGEGPGEFHSISNVTIKGEFVYISHYPHLSLFSIKGKLKKIIKTPIDSGDFIPWGMNFVGRRYRHSKPSDKMGKVVFTLYDENMRMKKDIVAADFIKYNWYNNNKINVLYVRDCIKALAYGEKLLIGFSNKEILFSIFDREGNRLYDIPNKNKKQSISSEYKQWRLDKEKEIFGKKWNSYKARVEIVFPDYYPAFSNFTIDRDKIYILTFPMDKPFQEILILDIHGKFLSKASIPLIYNGISAEDSLCIKDDRIYFLYDNEKTEKWEIRCHEMVTVDVDGEVYPCHRFLPWITGRPAPEQPTNRQSFWKPDECNKCKLIHSCPTCAGYNWEVHKDTGIRTTFHCEAYKLEVLASAKLEALKMNKRLSEIANLPKQEKGKIKIRLEAIMDLIESGI